MPPCPHWRSLGTIKQVESRRNGVNTEQWTLPFRPNTTCSWRLVRTRPDGSRVVCVAVEGDSHDLRAEIWIQQPKQGRIDQRFPIKLNEEFAFHPPASWRNIKCSVSIRRCSECEDEKAIRALAAVHAEAEEPTAEWAERREDAHEIPQELPLDEQHKAADNERATAAALENAQLAATIARLQSELEEREGEANAAIEREKALMEQRLLLKRQVDGLKSSLSDEQTRAASIQRELQRQVDELKSTLVSEQTRSSSLQEQLRNKVEELEKKARELEAAAIEREAQLTAVRQEGTRGPKRQKAASTLHSTRSPVRSLPSPLVAVQFEEKMTLCPHSVLFCVAGSELRDGRAESPTSSLPFRPGTSCRLEVLKQGSPFLLAKLVVDGDAANLLASVWTETMDGHLIGEKHTVLVNTWHFTCSTKPERRIYGRVWSEKCALCEKQREQERAASREQAAIHQFLVEERTLVGPPQPPTQRELQARIQQLEEDVVGKNCELANVSLKWENVELQAKIFALERKCGEHEQKAKEEAETQLELVAQGAQLQKELEELTVKLQEACRSSLTAEQLEARIDAQKNTIYELEKEKETLKFKCEEQAKELKAAMEAQNASLDEIESMKSKLVEEVARFLSAERQLRLEFTAVRKKSEELGEEVAEGELKLAAAEAEVHKSSDCSLTRWN
ncbi:hypothetical protein M3Y99_01432800 [Aphelenchoides fujianensis]|nr:hypothetical protein M3Y99_01432800 [Aphelenchoides fujianensis]